MTLRYNASLRFYHIAGTPPNRLNHIRNSICKHRSQHAVAVATTSKASIYFVLIHEPATIQLGRRLRVHTTRSIYTKVASVFIFMCERLKLRYSKRYKWINIWTSPLPDHCFCCDADSLCERFAKHQLRWWTQNFQTNKLDGKIMVFWPLLQLL